MTPLATASQIELRPYQQEALTAIEAAALRGVRRQVVSLPTGSGKTVIFAHLIVEQQTRTLILVHRDELIRQTLDKLAMVPRARRWTLALSKPSAMNTPAMSWSPVCRPCSAKPGSSGWHRPSDWSSLMSVTTPCRRTPTVASWRMWALIRTMVP